MKGNDSMGMEMAAYTFKGLVIDGRNINEPAPIDAFKKNRIVDPKWYNGQPMFRLTQPIRRVLVDVTGIDLSEGMLFFTNEEVAELYKKFEAVRPKYTLPNSTEIADQTGIFVDLMDFFRISMEQGYSIGAA